MAQRGQTVIGWIDLQIAGIEVILFGQCGDDIAVVHQSVRFQDVAKRCCDVSLPIQRL